MDSNLTTSKDLREFFFKKIQEAIFQQQAELSGEVEMYLVNILNYFSKSENLFQLDKDGKIEYRPLALMLYDAVFADPDEKFNHLKSLGDTALFHAGVFYDGLYNDVVDVEYYINMGGAAYRSLANISTHQSLPVADMYHQMSLQFPTLVELLNLSCEKETRLTDKDLLKLLDRYLKTGSKKAQEILKEEGIIPDQLIADFSE